jgi:hypothetical protein
MRFCRRFLRPCSIRATSSSKRRQEPGRPRVFHRPFSVLSAAKSSCSSRAGLRHAGCTKGRVGAGRSGWRNGWLPGPFRREDRPEHATAVCHGGYSDPPVPDRSNPQGRRRGYPRSTSGLSSRWTISQATRSLNFSNVTIPGLAAAMNVYSAFAHLCLLASPICMLLGLCHGDIKPHNILIAKDELKLTDFGSSFLPDDLYAKTRENGGTVLYSAPEVVGTSLRGRGGDPAVLSRRL